MDDAKITEIIRPGDENENRAREKRVRKNFWSTMKKAVRQMPFAEDVVASYYCALDPETPARTRGILLAALAYFVMPIDFLPDILAYIGFSDDIAVLYAAISAIRSNITDAHYAAARETLADKIDSQE